MNKSLRKGSFDYWYESDGRVTTYIHDITNRKHHLRTGNVTMTFDHIEDLERELQARHHGGDDATNQ